MRPSRGRGVDGSGGPLRPRECSGPPFECRRQTHESEDGIWESRRRRGFGIQRTGGGQFSRAPSSQSIPTGPARGKGVTGQSGAWVGPLHAALDDVEGLRAAAPPAGDLALPRTPAVAGGRMEAVHRCTIAEPGGETSISSDTAHFSIRILNKDLNGEIR